MFSHQFDRNWKSASQYQIRRCSAQFFPRAAPPEQNQGINGCYRQWGKFFLSHKSSAVLNLLAKCRMFFSKNQL